MDSERLRLEKLILGACLLENGYARVADVLTHRNFSKPDFSSGHLVDHQLIFEVFEKFYPLKPIDMWTVRHELKDEVGIDSYLAELSTMVVSTANLTYHAFTLLEYNMRSSFADLLKSKINSGAFNTLTLAALQEIIEETLDIDCDILKIIELSAPHLENIGADESLIKTLRDFCQATDKRIERIKKQSSIEILLNNLANLNTLSPDLHTRMSVSHLTDLLKAIIAGGKIEPEVANEIFKLKIR